MAMMLIMDFHKSSAWKTIAKVNALILIQEVRFCSKVGELEGATYRSFYRIRKQTACP